MWEATDRWECAVYWPHQGYGGATVHKTREEAVAEAKRMTGDSYRFAEAHIRHVVLGKAEVFKRTP